MHERVDRYETAQVFRTSPMVDSPVLWGRRTMGEILFPLVSGVGLVIFLKSSWPLVPAVLLFVWLPRLRERWGRGRAVHRLWAWGRHRELRMLSPALRVLGVVGPEWPPELFADDVVRRLRP